MSVNRPNNNIAEAHFYSKESAIYGSDERYLISSKGNRQEIPLTKACARFNGTDNNIIFDEIGNSGGWTIGFYINISSAISQQILTHNGNDIVNIDQTNQQITLNLFNGSSYTNIVISINQNGKSIPLNTWFSLIFSGDNSLLVYIDGILAGTGTTTNDLYIDSINPTENIKIYELFYYRGYIWNASTVLNIAKFNYPFKPDRLYHFEEGNLNTVYDIGSIPATSSTVNGTLTNFWYKGADVPRSYANREGYTLGAGGEIIPAKSTLLDVLNNDLQYKGQVRYRAKIKNPTVAFLDLTTTITFTVWPTSGVTFTYKGTATGVVISSTGVLSVTGAGTLYDLKVFFSGVLTEHYPLNEGSGSYINTIGTGRHGYLKGHTDPNQWVVADVEDVFLINNYEILKYDEDYRINDSLTIGDFPQYVTHVPGQGYEIENTIFSAAGTILTQQWSIATDSDYFLDLTYTYTAGTERTNISITANYQNQAIALPDGINSTIRLFYNNNQDSGFSFSMGNISTDSGKITLHSAKHYEVNKSKSDRPGYLPTNSQIDFNPDEALGENVPRNYVYGDTIPANAYMYINQSKRLPSTFDFLIYEKELTSSDEIRRITDYIS